MLNLGIVGLGSAGCATVASIHTANAARVIAAADIDVGARMWFEDEYDAPAHENVVDLCRRSDVDVIWIASPTVLHEQHAIMAAQTGKHVIVEKPMTFTLESAKRMIDACAANDVHLVCGGSRSSSATVKAAGALVDSGSLGQLRAVTSFAATDWMLRPRRPDEYDPATGGGVVFRQAPHVIDCFRYLAGGLVRSVRGVTGAWMAARGNAPGFYSAILEFENDVIATCVYEGYGYFMASELFAPDQAGVSNPGLAQRVTARRMIADGSDELARKSDRLQGLRTMALRRPVAGHEPFLADIGIFVVHCQEGELRQSPTGLHVYRFDGTEEVVVTPPSGGPPELEELAAAVEAGRPLLHSGAWGLATLEVCLGIIESARSRQDVQMRHQVGVFEAE